MALTHGQASTYVPNGQNTCKPPKLWLPKCSSKRHFMVSHRLRVRLERREAVLRLLDRRRAATGNPNLGSGMEKTILDLELADLETTMTIQENTQPTVSRNIRPTK